MLCDSITTHEADKTMKQAKLLTELDFKRLTAIIDSLRHSTRNHTAVALSFYAGLRACEIAALRIGDVFDAYGKPKDTIYLSAAQTKGNDSCTVLANKRLRQQLTRYAAQHPKQLLKPAAPLMVIPPFLTGCTCRTYAAIFSFIAGVMPPMPMLGRSLL